MLADICISKDHVKTSFSLPMNISEYEKNIIRFAINAYSFILPLGLFTYIEFANEIRKVYSLENSQNAEVIRILELIRN